MFTDLEVVPATAFEMKEDYDLYYISPDGKHVLRSDLAGGEAKVIATLDMDGIADRLCACPRKIMDGSPEETEKERDENNQRAYQKSGFDLFVLMNVDGVYETVLLLEDFSPQSAISLDWRGDRFLRPCDEETVWDWGSFRSFDDAENWTFWSDSFYGFKAVRVKQGYRPYINERKYNEGIASYGASTPFVQWPIRNGTHIAGDYAVFKLGDDQICILDPEKKRIALICRGFGPVVAKPPLEKPLEAVEEQPTNEVP